MTSGVGETTGLPTVQRDEIDGVPVYWVHSGRPTLAAALMFRTGIADETLSTSGWTHLVEHLALHGRERATLSVNGSTSLFHTEIQVHGQEDDVVEFLREVTRWFAAPDLTRTAEESRVLRAEAEYRGVGDPATALMQRYGARGPGLAGYTEPGLGRAEPALLRDLFAPRFVAGNAALVLDGPPPVGLRLELPPGERRAVPPAPRPADDHPAAYPTSGRLVLSGPAPRTPAATVLPEVLQDVLRRDLRETAGGAYAPWCSYEAVGSDSAVVLAGSDVARSLLPTVVGHVRSALQDLRDRGPAGSVVEDAVASAVQSMRDPYQSAGHAYRAAVRGLRGEEPQTPDEVVSELAAVTRTDVHDLLAEWSAGLLLGVPGDATWNNELPMLRMPQGPLRLSGGRLRSRNAPQDRSRLVVTEAGLAVGSDDAWQHIDADDIAGVLAFPDGARHVVSSDGWGITVEPTLWRRGDRAVALLDRTVPADLVLPTADRDPAAVPQPAGVVRRWAAWLRPYLFSLIFLSAVGGFLLSGAWTHVTGVVGIGFGLYQAVRSWPRGRDPSS